jgi:hypothetical protein
LRRKDVAGPLRNRARPQSAASSGSSDYSRGPERMVTVHSGPLDLGHDLVGEGLALVNNRVGLSGQPQRARRRARLQPTDRGLRRPSQGSLRRSLRDLGVARGLPGLGCMTTLGGSDRQLLEALWFCRSAAVNLNANNSRVKGPLALRCQLVKPQAGRTGGCTTQGHLRCRR